MTRVRQLLAGAACTVLVAGLAACSTSDGPDPQATLPTPPSASAADAAPGAAVLGDDPATSDAGKPVDTVDWVTPLPADAGATDPALDGCQQDQISTKLTTCVLGDEQGSIDVVVAGDSKTMQWMPALAAAGKSLGWRIVLHVKSACPFTTAPTARGGVHGTYPSCDAWNRNVISDVAERKPDIFINALYKLRAQVPEDQDREDARTAMIEGVRDGYARIARSGAQVIALNSTPILDDKAPECAAKHPDRLSTCATPRDRATGGDLVWDAASSRRALSGAPGSRLVDLNAYVCPAAECVPIIGNVLVYRDQHHITVAYMRTLEPMLREALARAAS